MFKGGDLRVGFFALTDGFLFLFSFTGLVFAFAFVSGVDGFLSDKGDLTTDGDFSFCGCLGVVTVGDAAFVTELVAFLGTLTFFFGLDLGLASAGFPGGFLSWTAFFFSTFGLSVVRFEGPGFSVVWAALM